MENGKPFIFVHPLSDALQLLLDEYKEKSEAENLEIYELDNVMEVSQVLPTLGQSLTITSSPKKCAQILQSCKKVIKRNNLKFILLSPKQLPWKVQEKLSKIGLTECAVEPLPQRTLSYKVNLHLRSIKVRSDEDQDEKSKTFGADGDNQFGDQDKQNLEKGILSGDSDEPEQSLSNSIDDLKKTKDSSNADDELIGEAGDPAQDPKDNLKDLMKNGLDLDLDMDTTDSSDPSDLLGLDPMNDTGSTPNYDETSSDSLMGDLKGLSEELGGNLEGKSNLKEDLQKDLHGDTNFTEEDQGGNLEGEGEAADQLEDLKGKSNFNEGDQGGNLEGDTESAELLDDLKGMSNFSEDDQGGNYEGDADAADLLNDMSGENNFKEGDQGGNYEGDAEKSKDLNNLQGKSNFKEQNKGSLSGEQKDGLK
ncbi:MAG: hypothetical protein KC493_11015, partial [Bacteriovoracaceae bacterium]|nr:hypothetical protein [Bacteriovoracaceae bacterium]